MLLALLFAVAGLEGDFESMVTLHLQHLAVTPESLWRAYIPALDITPQSGSFEERARQIALGNGWGAEAEKFAAGCGGLYIGPEAATSGRLLRLKDRRWTNTTLLLSGEGDILHPADVALVAGGVKRTTLCESSGCVEGHRCVRVGKLPSICVEKDTSLDEEAVLVVVLILLGVTVFIYLIWVSELSP